MTTEPTLTPAAFAAKWRGVTTTEKASAQSHFIDLCRMLGEPTPYEAPHRVSPTDPDAVPGRNYQPELSRRSAEREVRAAVPQASHHHQE